MNVLKPYLRLSENCVDPDQLASNLIRICTVSYAASETTVSSEIIAQLKWQEKSGECAQTILFENCVDPDQLASNEAIWSGAALLSMSPKNTLSS